MELENRTKRGLADAERDWGKLSKTILKTTAALVAVGAAATIAGVQRAVSTLDDIAKTAERTGFGAKELQQLRFAADQTGVSVEILDGALGRFTKRLGLARAGTGAAAQTYRQLGIDLDQTNNQVFRQVVDTIANMDDQTNRLAITTRLFGDDAQRLELTLRGGTAGLDAYAQKAQDLGLVFENDLLKSAEDAGDQLSIMKQVLDAQFTRAFIELAPAITSVGQAFADAAPAIASFFDGLIRGQEEWSANTLKTQISVIDGQIDHLTEKLEKSAQETTLGSYITNPFSSLIHDLSDSSAEIVADIKKQIAERDKLISLLNAAEKEDFLGGVEKGAESIIADILDLNKALDANALFNPKDETADKATKVFADQVVGMERTLAMLDLVTLGEQVLWETQKGRYRDLTDSQKQDLISAAERIDSRKKEIALAVEEEEAETRRSEERIKATEKAADAATRENEMLEAQAERWRDILDPEREVYQQLDELHKLLLKGKLSADEYAAAIEHILVVDVDELQGLWDSLGDTMASAFEDAILSGKGLSDIIKGLEKDILRIVTQQLITKPLAGFLEGVLGNIFGGAPGGFSAPSSPEIQHYHSGGIVGLAPNEVLGVLERGEEVLTERDPRHARNTSSRVINVTNNFSTSAPTSRATQQQMAAQAGASISRAMKRGS